MEREVSMAVEIAVALISISAFIAVLWFTVFVGEGIANDTSVEASGMITTIQEGRLSDLTNKNTVLPVSAVYSILRSNEDSIYRVDCGLCKEYTLPEEQRNRYCMLKHLTGKCSLEVSFDEDGGWYNIKMHKQTCDWLDGSCSCF